MREIKFRVFKTFSLPGMQMNYNPVIYKGMYCDMDGSLICDTYESDTAILMQYTGLKDRWGNEIYEGDIVKETKVYDYSDDIDVNIYQIIWNENVTGFTAEGKNGSNTIHQNNMGVCEVIGNIYENPEELTNELESLK